MKITLVNTMTAQRYEAKVIRHTKCFAIIQRKDINYEEKLNLKNGKIVNTSIYIMDTTKLSEIISTDLENERQELKVKIETFEGKTTAMWETDGPYFEIGIKGCPMGRGRDGNSAVLDLIQRTNMESGTDITVSDITENIVRNYDIPEVVEAKPDTTERIERIIEAATVIFKNSAPTTPAIRTFVTDCWKCYDDNFGKRSLLDIQKEQLIEKINEGI